MNINATFFVQMINFFILYVIIKRLLIKPAGLIIVKEQTEYQRFLHRVEQHEQALAHYRLERKQAWEMYRNFCAAKIPSVTCVTQAVLPLEIQVPKPIMYDQQTIDAIVNKTAHALIDKIKDLDDL